MFYWLRFRGLCRSRKKTQMSFVTVCAFWFLSDKKRMLSGFSGGYLLRNFDGESPTRRLKSVAKYSGLSKCSS